jgi:hypothetical protein
MAQTPRLLPSNYPQPLASQILKADAQRQQSMLRHEFAAELIGVLSEAREAPVRTKLTRLIETNLKSGLAAAQRSQELWPESNAAQTLFGEESELKPAQRKRFLSVFVQLDRVHRRSLSLLNDSFANIRLILDKIQAAHAVAASNLPAAASEKK